MDPVGRLAEPAGRDPVTIRPPGRPEACEPLGGAAALGPAGAVGDVGSLGMKTPGSPPSAESAPLLPAVVGGVTWAMSTADVATYSDLLVAEAPSPLSDLGAGRTAATRYWYCPGCSMARW